MTTAPDQPPNPNVSPSTPIPPAVTPTPPTNVNQNPPPILPAVALREGGQHATNNNPPHHFPFMMVTFSIAVIIAGLAASYLFFSFSSLKPIKKPAQILITPPVSVSLPSPAIIVNPFDNPSSDLTVNPFASPSVSATNPFGAYQNPFSNATTSGDSNQPYQNPFATATP